MNGTNVAPTDRPTDRPTDLQLTCGCLLCGKYFKNEHGVSVHVGKTHNKPETREALGVRSEGENI